MIFKVSPFLTLAFALSSPGLNAVAAISVPRSVDGVVQTRQLNGRDADNAGISFFGGGSWM
jgi:hypothetical protein